MDDFILMDVEQLSRAGSARSSPRPILKLSTNRSLSQSEQHLANISNTSHTSPSRPVSQHGVKWSPCSHQPTPSSYTYSQLTPPQSPFSHHPSPQPQNTPPTVFYCQAPPLTPRHSQNPMCSYASSMPSRSSSNAIIINPACASPMPHHGYSNSISASATPGYATPGRITPGRITPGRCTPVFAYAAKKRYIDIMLASTASTVAIDNKIEQAMDLVKSHLMFAVREEVDVLKERIVELMERINHLEYENNILKKYASPEALQQLQHQSPNP
ncbi:TSC22 domain family protein 1 isoform X4 [Hyalella azteca]|uniref:TSC22 domain family protein 1 isoform X4 n=1 Tax=Hyalella azteca TaxID=294128 RepID=A0A979FSW4_HYAAZ|nr:TSC22 domain family protein 1 isoform X4 [Hyalella azteca]